MNGYTQITLNGEAVGLKFAYECNKRFLAAYFDNQEIYSDDTGLSLVGYAKLFESAYRNNCAIKDVKPLFTTEDFYNWIEASLRNEAGIKQFGEIVTEWSESQNTKDIIEKMNVLNGAGEEKKTNVLIS